MENTKRKTRQAHRTPAPRPAVGEIHPVQDFSQYLRTYARQHPEMAALWCFGFGFVLGWKLKPW